MNRNTLLIAASLASIATAAVLMLQMREASAGPTAVAALTVTAAVPAPAETAPAPSLTRRERMARIVAEQAAITAEASARQALARRAAAQDHASR